MRGSRRSRETRADGYLGRPGAERGRLRTAADFDAFVERSTHCRWLGILGAVPVGKFAKQVEDAGGIVGHLDARLGRGPLRVGGEMGYLE